MTKLYKIKYHVLSKHCCRRAGAKSGTHHIEADNEEQAKIKLREIIPGARFEKIEEVEGKGG